MSTSAPTQTRTSIILRFQERSQIVLDAEQQDLLDREEAQRMIDRYRAECEQELADLVRNIIRP